jgi:hypothetical protein
MASPTGATAFSWRERPLERLQVALPHLVAHALEDRLAP